MAFVKVNSTTKHEQAAFERWRNHQEEVLGDVQKRQYQLFDNGGENEAEQDEDATPEELLAAVELRDRNQR